MATEGFVYVMARGDLHKIGHSRDPDARAKVLDGTIVARVPTEHARQVERALHAAYAASRIPGSEWFRLTPGDVAAIAGLTPDQIHNLRTTPVPRLRRIPVPAGLEGRRVSKSGARLVAFEIDAELKAWYQQFAAERGITFRRAVEDALRRHLTYPPKDDTK